MTRRIIDEPRTIDRSKDNFVIEIVRVIKNYIIQPINISRNQSATSQNTSKMILKENEQNVTP